jgi:hypothetical protein
MTGLGLPITLEPEAQLGALRADPGEAPIAGATWYTAEKVEDGLAYRFPVGALSDANYITADLLVDGNRLVVFLLELAEGASGPRFRLLFSALNECQARLRMPLEATKQNRWRYEREGAWLKPMCGGDVVDLGKVDRMSLTVLRKSDAPARFCLTPVTFTRAEPPLIREPRLPKGPLLDELGQSTLHE